MRQRTWIAGQVVAFDQVDPSVAVSGLAVAVAVVRSDSNVAAGETDPAVQANQAVPDPIADEIDPIPDDTDPTAAASGPAAPETDPAGAAASGPAAPETDPTAETDPAVR